MAVLIALDHDGTYTADKAMWDAFIALAQSHGHDVVCVTLRRPTEPIDMPIEVVYTSRAAKAPFMAGLGRVPDVWIDDSPGWIYSGSA